MSQRLSRKSRTQRVFDALLWLFMPVGNLMNTVFVVDHTSCVHCSGGVHTTTEQCENTAIIISHLRVATFVHKDVSTMQHIQMYTLHYTTPSHTHTPKHTTVHTRTHTHHPPHTHSRIHSLSCARTLFRDSTSTVSAQLLYIWVREDQSLTKG